MVLESSTSIPRFGADMITSYFLSESNDTIAYTNFNPSGRGAYPRDSSNIAFSVIFGNAPSFSVSIISPIDSRISFIAGHTASSAVVGSLSLLRKPLLCRWSFIPANTIVIGFISVCRCPLTQTASGPDQLLPLYNVRPKQRLGGRQLPKSLLFSFPLYRTPQR